MTDQDRAAAPVKSGRRRFLIGAGAVTVVVIGGVVYRGIDRGAFSSTQGAAYELWKDWDEEARANTALALVAAGVLAANPHNTQPWIFHLHDSQIDLYADRKRNLGTFDPYLREMYLGLGCAIENMMLAAPANGLGVRLRLVHGSLRPDYDRLRPVRVATLDLFRSEAEPGGLYEAIPRRHTNRGPYDRERPIAREDLSGLSDFANGVRQKIFLFQDGKDRQRFDRATIEATDAIISDEAMSRDSENWFRMSRQQVREHRDGITLEANGFHPAFLAVAKMMPPVSPTEAGRIWRQTTEEVHLATAPVTGLIAVRGLYDIPTTIDAGRLWQRMHLWAVTRGIAMHPMNQAVEMVDRELILARPQKTAEELMYLTGNPDFKPTFAFRMGYPARKAIPSPRRKLRDVVEVAQS